MSDVLHEHARMLARNLLRLQICTIGEIAETLELEPPEVQELAVEVYDERAEQLTALRQIMNDIGEKRAGRQQQEAMLFDAIGILNQCLHRREPGRGETADIRNWIHITRHSPRRKPGLFCGQKDGFSQMQMQSLPESQTM